MQDAAEPVHVCASTDLSDGGLGVKIAVISASGPGTAFFVRYRGKVHGYLNRCPHAGAELDWERSFFTRAGDLLMCARHGATFEPDTGLCVGGPCRNGRLLALDVQEDTAQGVVRWLPSGKVAPSAQPASRMP